MTCPFEVEPLSPEEQRVVSRVGASAKKAPRSQGKPSNRGFGLTTPPRNLVGPPGVEPGTNGL